MTILRKTPANPAISSIIHSYNDTTCPGVNGYRSGALLTKITTCFAIFAYYPLLPFLHLPKTTLFEKINWFFSFSPHFSIFFLSFVGNFRTLRTFVCVWKIPFWVKAIRMEKWVYHFEFDIFLRHLRFSKNTPIPEKMEEKKVWFWIPTFSGFNAWEGKNTRSLSFHFKTLSLQCTLVEGTHRFVRKCFGKILKKYHKNYT